MTRIIFHIDVNSAYLSWTAVSLLKKGEPTDLRTIPSIIGGSIEDRHGIVLAKSTSAKKHGIVTGEPIIQALQKCPNLIAYPPDFALYSKCSRAMFDILSEYSDRIEPFSIDEGFLDYTGMEALFGPPIEAAKAIQKRILAELGFTVNIGISTNKLLAKMASDFEKPDKVHTLFPSEIPKKMWPLPVRDLLFLGKASEQRLLQEGIKTIGDMARSGEAELKRILGEKAGHQLYRYANGIDDSTVVLAPSKAKGIGNSTTLSSDATTKEEACKVLLSLCESVGRRLRASHQLAGQICTEIRYSDFRNVSHQMPIDIPTASVNLLYEDACALFDELWDSTPIRLLGVRTSKLVPEDEPVQLSLFDFPDPRSEKQQKLDAALDNIRAKYGKDAIKRGRFL